MQNDLKIGELCAGYNGLGMAVEEVFGASPAWFSEYDAAPSKILAHHYPTVPNHGDMTRIDWAAIEPVDIISGGTPCQDLSAAGRRAGMNEGTRSNLWVQMREAVATQRPRYVVWENVRGAFSAEASSSVEQCPGCVGDTADGRVFLRALGRVLGDLSDLGYDCQWRGLRAADVGACHGRFRVFILAANRDHAGRGEQRRTLTIRPEHATTKHAGIDASDADSLGHERAREAWGRRPGSANNSEPAADYSSAAWRGSKQQHLPAPTGSAAEPRELTGPTTADADRGHDAGRITDQERGAEWREATAGSGEGLGTTADTERATRGTSAGQRPRPGEATSGRASGESGGHSLQGSTNWGDYAPAIRRWERVTGRSAPRPTEPTGRNNGHRLSPAFCEWMMGLPDGWVTDPAIGISRNEQLKACGNGVVPQQAMAALRDMLAAFQELEAAA